MAEKALKLPSGQIVNWGSQEFTSVYSNIMAFGLSPFDISLMFGEIGEATPTEVKALPRVKVILTPEQAANLLKLLQVALKAYVEGNGPLRSGGSLNIETVLKEVEQAKADINKGEEEIESR